MNGEMENGKVLENNLVLCIHTHTHTCIYKAPMNVAALGMETGVNVTMGYAQTWEVMHSAWS